MNASTRLIKGVLVAPIAAFIGGIVWLAGDFLFGGGMFASSTPFWPTALAFSILLTSIGYVAVIVLALPLHFFLTKIAAAQMKNYVLAGLFVAAIGVVIMRPFGPHFVGLMLWCSVLVSASFGYLVVDQAIGDRLVFAVLRRSPEIARIVAY